MAARHTSNRSSDGNIIGQDKDDKIGFYGTTAVPQQVLAAGASAAQIVDVLTAFGLTRKT